MPFLILVLWLNFSHAQGDARLMPGVMPAPGDAPGILKNYQTKFMLSLSSWCRISDLLKW
jgi:hypothetical protein